MNSPQPTGKDERVEWQGRSARSTLRERGGIGPTSGIPGERNRQTNGEDGKMRKFVILAVGLAVVVGLWAIGATIARARSLVRIPRALCLKSVIPRPSWL